MLLLPLLSCLLFFALHSLLSFVVNKDYYKSKLFVLMRVFAVLVVMVVIATAAVIICVMILCIGCLCLRR